MSGVKTGEISPVVVGEQNLVLGFLDNNMELLKLVMQISTKVVVAMDTRNMNFLRIVSRSINMQWQGKRR